MKFDKWLKKSTRSLVGKTVAVSGSTGGIGKELCYFYAKLGAKLIFLDRNEEKVNKLTAELRAHFPNLEASYIKLDLSNASSVIEATEKLLGSPPDHLILNAGVYHVPRYQCDIGYSNVFQINFVSPYYIAKSLLDKIKEKGGRIVAVGSIAHRYSKADEKDIDFSGKKSSALVYGNAKRYLTYSLLALGSPAVAIAHPGITFTNITAHYPKLIFAIIKHPMKVIFMKPKKACLGILRASFENYESFCWTGPRFFDVWGLPKQRRLKKLEAREQNLVTSVANNCYEKMKNFKTSL